MNGKGELLLEHIAIQASSRSYLNKAFSLLHDCLMNARGFVSKASADMQASFLQL